MNCLNVTSQFSYYSWTKSKLQYLLLKMSLWLYVLFLFSVSQDYVDVQSPQLLVKDEAEYHDANCLRAASVTLEDTNPIKIH